MFSALNVIVQGEQVISGGVSAIHAVLLLEALTL
jgi:hypothetical protein